MDQETRQKIIKYLNKLKHGNGDRDIYLKKLEYYLMEGGVLQSMMTEMTKSFGSINSPMNVYNINEVRYNNVSIGDIQQFGDYYNKLDESNKKNILRCLINPSDSEYNKNVCSLLFSKENNNINRNVFNLIQTYMLKKLTDIPTEIKNEILSIYKNITGEDGCLGFACKN